jgi:hypothetical protein
MLPVLTHQPSHPPILTVPSRVTQVRVNLLFLAGQVGSFAGDYVGCGIGDPQHDEVRWLTGTDSDAIVAKY